MQEETCRTCRFSMPMEESTDVVTCRKNPPQVAIDADGDARAFWPPVDGDQWCGCWEPARSEEES